MKGDEIVLQQLNRDSQETYVTEHKHMWKWMVEFLSKFEIRAIKIGRVNSNLITKFYQFQLFTLILYGVMVRYDVNIFKLTASA